MTLIIKPEVSVPRYGGFTISVPSKFKNTSTEQIQCTADDQASVSLLACDTLSEKEVHVTLATPIQANDEVQIEISPFQNPASTAQNKDFSVATLDSNGVILEMITTESSNFTLKLRQLSPNILTAFDVNTESDRIGATNTTLTINLTLSSDLPCQSDFTGCFITLDVPKLGNVEYPD